MKPEIFNPDRPASRWTWLMAPLLAVCALAAAQAQPVSVPSTPTNIVGSVDRMISYRFQEHMWQTADGATHLMVNRGPISTRGALTLYTSLDNGASWVAKGAIPKTDLTSTADGAMVGNDLRLVYSDNAGTIMSAVLRYDPATVTWTQQQIRSPIVYSDPTKMALSPGLGIDAEGRMWCAFAVQDRTTLASELRLSVRTTVPAAWSDTGQRFGDSGSGELIQRSAKPIRVPGGMGILASVEEKLLWATRTDANPVGAPWAVSTIYVAPPPYDADPFGGHFSLIDDLQNNLHLVTPDKGTPLYFRFDFANQVWEAPRQMAGAGATGYVQATRVGQSIVLVANNLLEQAVYRSDDLGLSFRLTHRLTHPPASGNTSYSPPRMETPAVSRAPVPLVQQYTVGSTQRLLWFEIPVD